MFRKRFKQAEREAVIAKWKSSALTQVAFAEQEGIRVLSKLSPSNGLGKLLYYG